MTTRLTVRVRLTFTFALIFVVSGATLIAITVGLAQHSIDRANAVNAPARQSLSSAINDILDSSSPSPSKNSPSPSPTPDGNPLKTSEAEPGATDSNAAAAAKGKLLAANKRYAAATGSSAVHGIELWSILAGLVLVPVSALIGWRLSHRALQPVRDVTAAARRVSANQLSERLALDGPADEINDLAATFDAMMDRLEHAFDAQRQFVANASHELRTPLTVATTAVEVVLAKADRSSAQLEAMAVDVRSAVRRANDVIDSLLTLTQSQNLDRRHDIVELSAVVEDALDDRRAAIAAHGIDLTTQLPEALVDGDRQLLERLVSNLVANAIDHNVANGRLDARLVVDTDTVTLMIANDGVPIAAEQVADLFEPFQRLEGRGHGDDVHLGLGLAISRAVAEAHGAELTATARPTGGLELCLRMAVSRMSPPAR